MHGTDSSGRSRQRNFPGSGSAVHNRGRLLSREQLISAAWGPGIASTDRAVDQHVLNLRRKIKPDPTEPRLLVSVRGLGYRFDLSTP